jgi:putative tricarboxylic transport membrane protein
MLAAPRCEVTRRGADLAAAFVATGAAAAYFLAAGAIQDSLLSDEVGAAGLPKLLAGVLAAAGLLLGFRAVVAEPAGGADIALDRRPFVLIAMLAGYVAVVPFLGFPLAIAALIALVARFAGLAWSWRLAAVAAGAGFGFWFAFGRLMGVPVPMGILAGLTAR